MNEVVSTLIKLRTPPKAKGRTQTLDQGTQIYWIKRNIY